MKRNVFLNMLAVASMFVACKKNSPTVDTNSANNGGATGGTTYAYSRIDIMTTGGNGVFDAMGNLSNLIVSDIGKVLQTTSGGNTKVRLIHAESAVITKYQGVWRATFSGYNPVDTAKQAYIQAIYVDETRKKIIEYRGYIIGVTSTLDYVSNTMPVTMDAAIFQSKFVSSTQKILLPQQ